MDQRSVLTEPRLVHGPERSGLPAIKGERAVTQATTDKPNISRGTFLKGVAAATATAAVSAAAADVVQAAGHIAVPYVKKSPSGEILIWVNGIPFTKAQVATFNKVYPNVKVKQQVTAYVPVTPSLSAHL